MSKKGKISVGLCILLLISGVLFSSAFLKTKIKTTNVVTFGNIKIQLLNYELDKKNKEVEVTREAEQLRTKHVSRIIRVKNISFEPAFVRVKLQLNIENEEKVIPAKEYVNISGTDEAWIEDGEWLYYRDVVNPNMQTGNLMQNLTFNIDRLTNDYPGSTIRLHVDAQAVQSKHNDTNVLSVQGWPQEVNK